MRLTNRSRPPQIHLVLPWKYSIFIEYHLKSAWPAPRSGERSVQFELSIRGTV